MKKLIGLLVLGTLTFSAIADAKTPEEEGQAVARDLGAKNTGWKDLGADVDMTLEDGSGGKATRKFRIKALERPDASSGDWLMVVFDAPADVKGTAVLSHARVDDDDEQWLYLPSTKRTRRVASSNKSGSFAGSEFSFEDLAAGDGRKYTWKLAGKAPCGGGIAGDCFQLEATPKDPASAYSKRVLAVDTQEYRVVTVDFFDRKNQKMKTLSYGQYEKIDGKFWRAKSWTMKNLQTGKSTVLTFTSLKMGNGYTTSDFATAKLGG